MRFKWHVAWPSHVTCRQPCVGGWLSWSMSGVTTFIWHSISYYNIKEHKIQNTYSEPSHVSCRLSVGGWLSCCESGVLSKVSLLSAVARFPINIWKNIKSKGVDTYDETTLVSTLFPFWRTTARKQRGNNVETTRKQQGNNEETSVGVKTIFKRIIALKFGYL